MPVDTLELEDEETLEAEDAVLEEEEVDELTPDTDEPAAKKGKKKKTKKRTMSEDNTYLFDDKDESKAGLENLKYSDGTAVEGFRVWDITKNFDDENKESVHQIFVLARGQFEASHRYIESKNYTTELKFRKTRGGKSGPRKISKMILQFGRTAAKYNFIDAKPNGKWLPEAPAASRETWGDSFGPGGLYSHYLDDDNNWKSTTTD